MLVAIPCPATTWTVDDNGPADYDKIQDAINVAVDGDIVQVFKGHYFENIDFWGKAITVTGTNPNDPNVVENTIIDANGSGIVVSFHMGEDPNSVINGFKITGGHAKYGAGICCWDEAYPTIINCIITENDSLDIMSSQGAGIYGKGGEIINGCSFDFT